VQVSCPNDRIRRGFLPGSLKSVEVVFFAYVLKSINHDFFYKGHCEDLVERLKQHNSGHTKSIRPYLPIVLIYKEEFATREEAIKREKYFKSSAGRRYLKNKLVP